MRGDVPASGWSAAMAGGKSKASCRVATVGDKRQFFMLPRCVIDSEAYRMLSVHARAALIEIGARMDGFNNGKNGVDQRTIRESLRCSPRKVVRAVAELMEHGLLDVAVEGRWTEKMAREYRLTFVSTPRAPATNDYLQWVASKKFSATGAVAERPSRASGAVAAGRKPATDAVTAAIKTRRETAKAPLLPATGEVAHITKPYPEERSDPRRGDRSIATAPLTGAAFFDMPAGKACERCNRPIAGARATKRFCSEPCRKSAERARHYQRNKHTQEAQHG